MMATSADRGVSSNSYYWQCLIRVMDVIDRGSGYNSGMEFDLFWPPVRSTEGEKTNRTPYFPDYRTGFQHPESNLLAYYEESKNVDRYSLTPHSMLKGLTQGVGNQSYSQGSIVSC